MAPFLQRFESSQAEKGDKTHKPEPGGGPHSFALRILRLVHLSTGLFSLFSLLCSLKGVIVKVYTFQRKLLQKSEQMCAVTSLFKAENNGTKYS